MGQNIIISYRALKPINPRSAETIYLITDASNTGISSWIGQKGKGLIRPTAFHFMKLNNSQVYYRTMKKELFAIYYSMKPFRGVLLELKFGILTPPMPLLKFMKHIPESELVRRWSDTMSQFNFSLKHIKGKANVIADMLSRCVYNETEIPTSKDHSLTSP